MARRMPGQRAPPRVLGRIAGAGERAAGPAPPAGRPLADLGANVVCADADVALLQGAPLDVRGQRARDAYLGGLAALAAGAPPHEG